MKRTMLLISIVIGSFLTATAQKSETFIKNDAAIRGYDPVAYFTESKPVKGSKEFTYNYNGANWYFASKKNLDAFKANPQKYAPQYGGYCAYGLSKGYKATTEPDAWTIVNGKLYLNYDTDVRDTWNKNQKEFIQKADKNWPTVKNND